MSTYSKGVVVLLGHTFIGLRDQAGSYSPPAVAITPAKAIPPLPPTLTELTGVPNAPGTLQLSLKLPSTNADGSILAISEIVRLRVHFKTSQGVSISDPYNDFPPAEVITWAPNMSGKVYVRARVQDSHGNWSQLSNELYADVPEVKPFEFWAHRIKETAIFSNNTPSAGYVSWSGVTIYFKNLGYEVADGSTNKRYIFWKLSNPGVFQTSDEIPNLSIDDVLIGTNINGTWHIAIYHPQVSAEFIRVGKLQSTNWGESTGSELDLDTGTFKLGGSSSPKLSWDGSALRITGTTQSIDGSWLGSPTAVTIDASGLNVGSTGRIVGGATGPDSGVGFWLGYSDGAYKFFVGNSTGNRLTWDGTQLSIIGNVTVSSGFGPAQLANPGLELGNLGWTLSGAWTIASGADARSGSSFLKAVVPSASSGTARNDFRVFVSPGQTLVLTAWLKTSSTITGSYGIRINWRDASGGLISSSVNSSSSPSTTYFLMSVTGTAPPGAVFADAEVFYLSATGTFFADDFEFRRTVGTAVIEDASITTAKIADLAVTSAKIASLTFDKLTAGTNTASLVIGSGGEIRSANYVPGSSGFRIQGSGVAEFSQVTVRGTLIAGPGSRIDGTYLTGTATGLTVRGSSTYPYAEISGSVLCAYQSAAYFARLTPSSLAITGLSDTVELTVRSLSWQYGEATIRSGSALKIVAGGGWPLEFETTNGWIWFTAMDLRPTSPGGTDLGTALFYWNNINYKSLIDRGCLGSFEDGVELQDGRRVSDLEALREIRAHPTLRTPYGTPRLDYSTLPVAVYRPAPVARERIKEGDRIYEPGEKMGEDGACLDALVSIMLGAIKELDRRLIALERKIGDARPRPGACEHAEEGDQTQDADSIEKRKAAPPQSSGTNS